MSTITLVGQAIDPPPPPAGQFTLFARDGVLFVIDEFGTVSSVQPHAGTHEDGGTDELNVTGLSGVLADGQTAAAHGSTHDPGGADAVSTATPGAIAIGDAATEGVAASLTRADHQHSLASPSAPEDVTKAAASTGAAPAPARADHKHDVSTATPVDTGGANAEGSSTALSRADHVHALGAHASTHLPGGADALTTAAPGTIQPDDAAVEGVAVSFARSDHTHAIVADAPSQGIGGGNSEGASTSFSRADHGHTIRTTDGPTDLTLGAIADGEFLTRSATTIVGVDGVQSSRTITAGAGLTGGGDLSADRTLDAAANADGSITINVDDIQVGVLATDAQHGARGGGTQHADVVAAGASGFMPGADKSKLDGIPASAVPTSRNLTAGAGMTGGGDLSADRTFDSVANVDGSIVVNADDVQVGVLATDAQHGTRGGGTQHALAIASGAAGFLSGADKATIDAAPFLQLAGGTMAGTLNMGSQDITTAAGVDAATVRSGRLAFTASTNTAALGSADAYACTDTSAARTLTISTSTIAEGTATRPRAITVTDDSGGAGTNNITIATEGAQTIDGAATAVIVVGYGTIALLSDGSSLTSIGGSGKTNAVDRVPLTADPTSTIDVWSVNDLPDAITAPDGVLRIPLESVQYIIHTTFVWPRLMLPIAAGIEATTIKSAVPATTSMLISGDSTPHIWGRNIGVLLLEEIVPVDISNFGTGRGTVLFDLTGGVDAAFVLMVRLGFVNFKSLGDTLDVATSAPGGVGFQGLGGGIAVGYTGVLSSSGFGVTAPGLNELPTSPAALKPMWSFVGPSSTGIGIAIGGIKLNPGDSAFYIDPSFTGSMTLTSIGYDGASSGNFFRPDVSLGLTAEASADKSVTAFAADVRTISSVTIGAGGTTFVVGTRHNWRVGDSVTHTGFTNAGYNGVQSITFISPFSYAVTAVTFVGGDSGTATHDLSTLVTSAGHGLYRGQTVLLGGATPGAYAGTRVILAVEDDEDGFTIPVVFSVGGTGTIQVTRITTASDHPMVRGEQHTISGTAAYNGTRAILGLPADDQFDISAAFSTDEGATGTVVSSSSDETDLLVQALGNGAQKDSKSIGSVVATANAQTTDMSGGPNAWTDFDLDALAVAGSNIERWGSVDSTTGEVTYNGVADFSGELLASLSVTSIGGSQSFQFRAVVNGSSTSDGVVVSVDLSSSPMIVVTLTAPIQASPGDTVRLQVQNTSGISNVLIQELSMGVR